MLTVYIYFTLFFYRLLYLIFLVIICFKNGSMIRLPCWTYYFLMIELCPEYLSVRCNWLYVLIMSCTRFRVNLHSTVAWMSRNSLTGNYWVFVYKLNGSRFESSYSHLNFRLRTCFEQGVPWQSGNYRVWIYSETRTWHDKNMQLLFLLQMQSKKYYME